MANRTRQVHRRKSQAQREEDRRRFKETDDRAWEECKEEVKAKLLARLMAGEFGPFYTPEGARRKYPGESEAICVLNHMENGQKSSSAKKLKAFLKEFRILRNYEEQCSKGNAHESPAVGRVWMELEKRIRKDHIVTVDVLREGLLVQPSRPEGITALALLSLSVQHRRLTRIRACLHCGSF